jgi:hypothetical protein
MAPVSEEEPESGFPVLLTKLDETGGIDFSIEPFALTYQPTRDDQVTYSRRLADILRLKVLEIRRS